MSNITKLRKEMIMESRETNKVMRFRRETQRAEGLAGTEAESRGGVEMGDVSLEY